MAFLAQGNDPVTAATSGQGSGHWKFKNLGHSSGVKQGFVCPAKQTYYRAENL